MATFFYVRKKFNDDLVVTATAVNQLSDRVLAVDRKLNRIIESTQAVQGHQDSTVQR